MIKLSQLARRCLNESDERQDGEDDHDKADNVYDAVHMNLLACVSQYGTTA
jgi:hypothetical protein